MPAKGYRKPLRYRHPGEHWRELIAETGRANVVIALDLDITQKHLSQVLVGNAMPSVHLVIAFAELMRVPIEPLWLLQCEYVLQEALRQRRADEHRRRADAP